MRRESAFRSAVRAIPILGRVKNGDGGRIELKIDITPDNFSISGLSEKHEQVTGTREYFSRETEENPALGVTFLAEVLARGLREIPKRQR